MPEQIIGKIPPASMPNSQGQTPQPNTGGTGGWGKNIGGILGGTVGQILGTPADIIAGPGGTMAGGAIGGGIGGSIGEGIDQLMSGKGLDLKKIAGAGGEQAAYGAIPVGEEMRAIPLIGKMAGNVMGNTAIRGTVGGVTGGLAQMANNLGQGKPLTDNVVGNAESTAIGNIASPAVSKALGLVGKGITAPAKFAFDTLPKSIQSSLDLASEKLGNLDTKKLADLVGYKNIQAAKDWGITASHLPQDVVDEIVPQMKTLGEELNTHLSADGAATTLQDVRDAFSKAQNQVAPGLKDVNMQDFSKRVDDFLRQNLEDAGIHPLTQAPVGGAERGSAGKAPQFTNRTYSGRSTSMGPTGTDLTPIPLNIVNSIKQRLGERFGDDPLYEQAYHNLQNLIEKKSGQPDIIKGINQEYNTLREIKNSAEKQLESPSTTVLNYNAMKQDLSKRKIIDPGSATMASLAAASTVIPGIGHVAAGLSGGYALYRILNNALHDPVAAAKIIGVLQKPGQFAQTGVGQALGKTGDAIGTGVQGVVRNSTVRLPAAIMNLISGQQGQSNQLQSGGQ